MTFFYLILVFFVLLSFFRLHESLTRSTTEDGYLQPGESMFYTMMTLFIAGVLALVLTGISTFWFMEVRPFVDQAAPVAEESSNE